MRRAALSIPSNIAEGCGEGSRKETIRFLHMAARSAAETESHLIIASDMGFVSPDVREQFLGNAVSIRRMLAKLIANLP
jgi:four helix bundle protein